MPNVELELTTLPSNSYALWPIQPSAPAPFLVFSQIKLHVSLTLCPEAASDWSYFYILQFHSPGTALVFLNLWIYFLISFYSRTFNIGFC